MEHNLLRDDNHQIEILKDIAEKLNETNDVSAAMDAILPRLGEVLGLSTAWAFRFDPKRSSFVEVGASGLPPALAVDNAAPLKCDWCECQEQFVEGKLNTAVNIVRCSRLRDALGDKAGLAFHASIPLRSKDKPLGILNVAASGRQVFTKQALDLLTAIGHQVAVAIDRAGILTDERLHASQLRALSEVAAELVSVVNPSHILQYAVDRFVEQLGYASCGIVICSADEAGHSEWALVAAAHAKESDTPSEYSYAPDQIEPLLPERERVLLPDARSYMMHPVPHSEYHVRIESSAPHAFRDIDEDILSAFAWHLTAALENATLYQQSLASAKWAERRRLAADLHDAVSQRLFSAILTARTASMQLAEGKAREEIDQTLARLQTLISESQEEMRDLIKALRPVDERGFVAMLRDRIEPLQLQANTRIQLTSDANVDEVLSFSQREALMAIVDEALHNLLKHAHAKHAYVTVARLETSVLISIQDDGVGFAEDQINPGLGTSTMYERTRRIGGTLRLHTLPGRGTTVVCEIPLKEDAR